jgi:hypothetical protein
MGWLWLIVIILVLLWFFGQLMAFGGNLVHILLVIAIIIIAYRLLKS